MEVVVQNKGKMYISRSTFRKEYIGIEHNKRKVKFDFGNSKV